ncbi:MAG: nicotinate-nucleotide adenylyltransferase [Chthoniobacter sp.]|jgi:nicotinate-nucleotide adenylyltransferase|nr:nicotinate-nucleotide adenylyltransferase [Chthoniobacter sp.]
MKIGFYGGTFDPIHVGHLILARDAVEYLDLSRLIFIPNTISPHKQHRDAAPAAVRREMVAAAIENDPLFLLDESEVERGGTSYTINTILLMKERYPDAEFFFLIGEDNVRELHTWRRIDELTRLVQFVVLNRTAEKTTHAFVTLRRRIDVAATEIRQRVARGESIRYMVPDKVLAIIKRENLYRGAGS